MVKFIMPDNLSEETSTFMTDVIKELNKRRVIQNIDLGALRMLATSYETYKRATDAVLKDGAVIEINRTPTLNPAQNAATKSYSQVMKIMTEYGLTIKSRSNISSLKNEKKATSPLGAFLGKKSRRGEK
ncbi:Phage terminase, small subunit [Bacteroidales bacterium Barb6XT]|nr:Phage terminase, small subunit [Bacteroidales bacterium Barb6XT]